MVEPNEDVLEKGSLQKIYSSNSKEPLCVRNIDFAKAGTVPGGEALSEVIFLTYYFGMIILKHVMHEVCYSTTLKILLIILITLNKLIEIVETHNLRWKKSL